MYLARCYFRAIIVWIINTNTEIYFQPQPYISHCFCHIPRPPPSLTHADIGGYRRGPYKVRDPGNQVRGHPRLLEATVSQGALPRCESNTSKCIVLSSELFVFPSWNSFCRGLIQKKLCQRHNGPNALSLSFIE